MPDLRTMFVVVAIVEAAYGAAGLLTPPSLTGSLLGWNLTADGQWVTKLLGAALATQAVIAWSLRRDPPLAVAWAFAAYQIGATLIDVALWFMLADQGIFGSPAARVSVLTAIPTHLLVGLLLIRAILAQKQAVRA